MLCGLPRSIEETAVLLSSSQHIKDPCFYFLVCSGLMLCAGTAEEDPRVAPVSFVNSPRLICVPFSMCIYFSRASLWSLFQTATNSFRNTLFWLFLFEYKSQVMDLSFFLYAWTDLITCIQFSLFIQPALCFPLPCFIYGSHVLWLQLQCGFPKA